MPGLLRWCALFVAILGPQEARADGKPIPIHIEHIFDGGINRQGELVGVHHLPSAPKEMEVDGKLCKLEIAQTSPGGKEDVVTAHIILRDPVTKKIVREKASTLFPAAWSKEQIEKAIREAYADAKANGGVEKDGRWGGEAGGVRIEGYLTCDGGAIATAFPIYVKHKKGGKP